MSAVDIFPTGTGSPPPSAPLTTSATQIFPSATEGPRPERGGGSTSNGVYYLVFLGVLLALIILAGALTLRSYRTRARYRTQTQLAIARGDAPSGWWGDDMWGVPWVGWAPVRSRRERRWMPIPTLFDAVPEPEKDDFKGKGMETDFWDDIQPLTVHSLLAPEPEPELEQQPFHLPEMPGGRLRTAGAGFRRRMRGDTASPPPDPPPPAPRTPEMGRPLSDGEPVRVAVVVQMPTESSDAVSALSDDDEVGWRPGMEIGVWEGVVAGGKRSMSSDDETFTPHTFTYPAPPGPPPSHLRPNMSNPYNPYDLQPGLSVDTGDIGSGSTLWTPASKRPSPATHRTGPMEPTPEVPHQSEAPHQLSGAPQSMYDAPR